MNDTNVDSTLEPIDGFRNSITACKSLGELTNLLGHYQKTPDADVPFEGKCYADMLRAFEPDKLTQSDKVEKARYAETFLDQFTTRYGLRSKVAALVGLYDEVKPSFYKF